MKKIVRFIVYNELFHDGKPYDAILDIFEFEVIKTKNGYLNSTGQSALNNSLDWLFGEHYNSKKAGKVLRVEIQKVNYEGDR